MLSKNYLSFIDKEIQFSRDIRLRYLLSFIKMARKFRLYWNAIRSGDRVIQEKICCEWLGIFHLLGKKNYVEICLCMMEKEYEEITYKELSQIRVNSSVRYY